ncbi:MAG: GDSL-type esterase/lipase family protein [Prevotellaceae bacterium]|jgi:lysophospholipase L1-like esterase|nr:GDSL-type esterase/lipase family protein [Prevotellaceae bacterium]
MRKTIITLLITLMSAQFVCCSNGNDTQILQEEQAALQKSLKEKYPFLKLPADSITGSEALAPFFEKMRRLPQNRVVSIVHIGDSHIQADMMTEEVRLRLQKDFGNAGRGLIFPHRIARSNEPNNIQSSASGTWQQVSIISKNRLLEPGVATRAIFTADTSAAFNIAVKDYLFNRMTVLAPRGETFYDFCVSGDSGEKCFSAQSADNTFLFNNLCNTLSLKITPTADTQKEFRLNGIILQNDTANGILYHSMGTNGAHFGDYNNSPEFFHQLADLSADLIIISLGTNEGAARDITQQIVYDNALKMIENIRVKHPDTPILLTTPTHNFYQKKYINPRIKIVEEGLLRAAADAHCAVIDLYAAGGGNGSCRQWRAQRLLRADGVHFTEEGYRLQGDLIYNAIIDTYIKYAN